jgi:hypothetical protein
MRVARRVFVVGVAVAAVSTVGGARQIETSSKPALSPQAMEAFLREARIVDEREEIGGVTGSRLVTLSDGTITHDAHLQTVDISQALVRVGGNTEMNFKDTYRYNIAAYRVAQLIGLPAVPMSVERVVDSKDASMTWWVDDVAMDEKARLKARNSGPNPERTNLQLQTMYVFDELIQNKDRNQGNILWDRQWTLWLIDHTRAFRLEKKLLQPARLRRCDRRLFEGMKAMTEDSLEDAAGDYLTKYERESLLERRDRIVKLYTDRIAKQGEAAVLYTSR